MRPNIKNSSPSSELVKDMLPASGTGSYRSVMVARIPFNTTSTAAAATNWINPETGTVVAKTFYVFTTAGTGTTDIGVGSDGTNSVNGIIDGGTLTVGVHYPQEVVGTVAASAIKGGEDKMYVLVGPGGTGSNNSITMTTTDTVSSTAVGALFVQYYLIGA